MTNLQEVVWAQEEPRNNGYWSFVEPLIELCLVEAGAKPQRPVYAGRASSASPATGLAKRHQSEQIALIEQALGLGGQAEQQRKAS
jgi:2-oxoglutarate dehydrogenase E1 component